MAVNGLSGNSQASSSTSLDSGMFGVWRTLNTYKAPTSSSFLAQSNRLEGFVADGDFIELPLSAAGVVEYFNSSEVSQWTVSLANIDASLDEFVGFIFDDDLVYVIAVDTGTTPHTFYTASIDVAGTIVNIGNAQPGNDFTITAAYWDSSVNAHGSTSMQRDAIGSGNLTVLCLQAATVEEMEINITTGAVISNPTAIPNMSDIGFLPWRALTGIYTGMISAQSTPAMFHADTGHATLNPADPINVGLPVTSTNDKIIQWKNTVALVTIGTAANRIDPQRWLNTEMEQFIRFNYNYLASTQL